jgi:hypothetical protein
VFISEKSAVDSGGHNATNSMHIIKWPTDGKLNGSFDMDDVVWNLFVSLLCLSKFDIFLPEPRGKSTAQFFG